MMTRSPKHLLALVAATAALAFPWALAQQQSANVDLSGVTRAPIQAGGVVALDLPDSSAQSMSIDIVKGRFSDYSVGRLTLTGLGIDLRDGTLQGLRADIQEGDFENLLVEKLHLDTPAFSFNTMELLNNRTFLLSQPVTARVSLQVSESALNRFLANPRTLDKVEKAIQKKTGGFKLVTFANPSLDLLSGGKVRLNVMGVVAQGLGVPMEMSGKMGIQNGQVAITDLALSSGGNALPLPVDVAKVFQEKINEMIDFKRLGKNNFVINAQQVKLQGKTLIIDGDATLTKLQFGA